MINLNPISTPTVFKEYRTEGHSPLLVMGEDSENYVIKNDKGRKPPYCILNEIIAAIFLPIWEVEIPNARLINLPVELLENNRFSNNHKVHFYEGPVFASKHIVPVTDLNEFSFVNERKSFKKILNPDDLFKIALFDTWLENDDRKPTNYNLLLQHIGNDKKIIPIDHAFILSTLSYKDLNKNQYSPISNEQLLVSDFGRMIKRFTKIDKDFISNKKQMFYLCVKECVKEIKEYVIPLCSIFDISNDELEHLIDFLKDESRNKQVFEEFIYRLK